MSFNYTSYTHSFENAILAVDDIYEDPTENIDIKYM